MKKLLANLLARIAARRAREIRRALRDHIREHEDLAATAEARARGLRIYAAWSDPRRAPAPAKRGLGLAALIPPIRRNNIIPFNPAR